MVVASNASNASREVEIYPEAGSLRGPPPITFSKRYEMREGPDGFMVYDTQNHTIARIQSQNQQGLTLEQAETATEALAWANDHQESIGQLMLPSGLALTQLACAFGADQDLLARRLRGRDQVMDEQLKRRPGLGALVGRREAAKNPVRDQTRDGVLETVGALLARIDREIFPHPRPVEAALLVVRRLRDQAARGQGHALAQPDLCRLVAQQGVAERRVAHLRPVQLQLVALPLPMREQHQDLIAAAIRIGPGDELVVELRRERAGPVARQ